MPAFSDVLFQDKIQDFHDGSTGLAEALAHMELTGASLINGSSF